MTSTIYMTSLTRSLAATLGGLRAFDIVQGTGTQF